MKFSASIIALALLLTPAAATDHRMVKKNARRCPAKPADGDSSVSAVSPTATLIASSSTSVATVPPPASSSSSAPPVKPTAATTPAPPEAKPAANNIKRGLSYNDVGLTRRFSSSQVGWAYNWDSTTPAGLPGGVTFFPMFWNIGHAGNWVANANAAIAKGATHLLL